MFARSPAVSVALGGKPCLKGLSPVVAGVHTAGTESASSPKPATKEPSKKYFPNADTTIWLRSCTHEVEQPLTGVTTGTIPAWLKGTLLRNGPGKIQFGETRMQHLFDSAALLHRFAVKDGKVTYQRRFLRSKAYHANMAAKRIVVTEFGTSGVPDPCQTIFQRVAAVFNPGEAITDNAMVSVYPFGDEYYAFTETPVIHRIDPATLETLERVNVSKHLAIGSHTSHPLVANDGTVYNVGMTFSATGVNYSVMKFPPPKITDSQKYVSPFNQATIVSTIPCRWRLHPSYMHSFGMTENYFVIVEQPLSVSMPKAFKGMMNNEPPVNSLQWFKDEKTHIHLVNKSDGSIAQTFVADAFCYMHAINCYELDGHAVVDLCCYKDAEILNSLYVDALEGCHENPDYARMFRSRPLRFVLPLNEPNTACTKDNNVNLVTLDDSEASAHQMQTGDIFVKPELLCEMGCETPQVNLAQYLGKPYRYFYGISSDVDLENPGTLIKVDTKTRIRKTWCEKNVFPSEPIFVPTPNALAEDDGLILSAIVWGNGMENKVALLILDASTMEELGRTVFDPPGPVPLSLHGWFAPDI